MRKISFIVPITLILVFMAGYLAYAAETPEQVYAKYVKAIKKGDFNKMTSYITKKNRDKMLKSSEKEKKMGMAMIQSLSPISYKIDKKEIKGNKAVLHLSGQENPKFATSKDGKTFGEVILLNENGHWKIEKENWSSTSKAK